MKKNACFTSSFCLVALMFFASAAYAATPDNGTFGSYIVGTFDMREGYTEAQVINPTTSDETVCVALFDPNGTALVGKSYKISSNGLVEVNVKTFEPKVKFGVVKVIVVKPSGSTGVAGFQRFYSTKMGMAVESNLASVPLDLMKGEYEKIMALCKK